MRVSQLAELTGTTVRAIRYYHQRGLLHVPADGRDGFRDYTMRDALRVLQIRLLVDAGLPADGAATPDDPALEVAERLPPEAVDVLIEERAAFEILAAHGRLPAVLEDWAAGADADAIAAAALTEEHP